MRKKRDRVKGRLKTKTMEIGRNQQQNIQKGILKKDKTEKWKRENKKGLMFEKGKYKILKAE